MMPSSNHDISNENIDEEIYKTYGLFKQQKNVAVADFLNKFPVENLIHVSYRTIKFPGYGLIRALLLQGIKGIKFQTQLQKYLQVHRGERNKIGLHVAPDQRTLSHFYHDILDKTTKETLDYMIYRIVEISEKFDILLDLHILKPEKPIKVTKNDSQYQKKRELSKEASRIFKKRVLRFIDLRLGPMAKYTKNQIFNLPIHIGVTRDFAENGQASFEELTNIQCIDPDTFFYHIKKNKDSSKMDNLSTIQKLQLDILQMRKKFAVANAAMWELAHKYAHFHEREGVELAIDTTDCRFFGKKMDMIINTMEEKKKKKKKIKNLRFGTAVIVEPDKRFTISALPIGPLDGQEKILKQLLCNAKERVKIKRVYLDRAYFNSFSIKVLQELHLKYIIPCTEYSNIKKILEIAPAPRVIKNVPMKDITFNMIILIRKNKITGKDEKRAYATNEEICENDVPYAERLADLYNKRWGIESSYDVEKNSFLAKTVSRDYCVRLFYFLFAVLLYNLWIIADILMCLAILGIVKAKKRLIKARFFGTILCTTNEVDSGDPG